MKNGKSSMTAMGAAAFRSIESMKHEALRVCFDPYAVIFLSPFLHVVSKSRLLTQIAFFYINRKLPGIFNEVVARTRYIDDCVIRSIDAGMTQLVIMGAGYDTRAHRIPEVKQKMRVFEVDHPDTQSVKIKKMKPLLDGESVHVHYVPVDFERQTIHDRLPECGYDPSQKTFFIWEGVSMYLSPEAVDDTLAFVRSQAAVGSGIIFNYCLQSLVDGTCTLFGAEKFRNYVMKKDEPLLFGMETGMTEAFLKQRGFSHVIDADGKTLAQMYFTGPNKGRRLPEFGGIAYAVV